MFKKIFYFKKAAVINAAFFIFSSLADARLVLTTFDSVRSKASLLLLQKQKKQAMAVVSDYVANETNKVAIAEASDFLLMISKTFLSKEAQEAYETSINLTSDNSKESLQQVEVCLQLEPQNAECLIQRLRLAVRLKNKSLSEKTMAMLEEAIPGTIVENWAALIVKKHEPDFKSKSIVKKLTEKPSEDVFVLTTLELDRAFEVNNFSRAKDVMQYLEKNYSDWPDLIYYKQKINTESAENKIIHSTEINTLYLARCKNLSKSTARKYRYDFELCIRGSL